jgi:hypothetical protein
LLAKREKMLGSNCLYLRKILPARDLLYLAISAGNLLPRE